MPEKVPEKVWQALVQSQVKFNRVPDAEPSQVQLGSGEDSGEGVGGFGAETRLCSIRFGRSSGEGAGKGSGRLWCRLLRIPPKLIW